MQILNSKRKVENLLKKWFWEGLGLHLGGVWGGLGPLLAALGRHLLVLWVFKIQFFSSMGPTWAPKGLLGRFWDGLGRIWGGFGEGLGGNLEGLDVFWKVVGTFWKHLEKCGPAGAKLLNGTPALIREASQSFFACQEFEFCNLSVING